MMKDTMMLLGTWTLYGLAFAAGYFALDAAFKWWRNRQSPPKTD